MLEDGEQQPVLDIARKPLDQIPAQECPCCSEWVDRLKERAVASIPSDASDHILGVVPTVFKRHLASHLEQLALFAIPIGSAAEGDVDSNVAVEEGVGALSGGSDLSILTFDSSRPSSPASKGQSSDDVPITEGVVKAAAGNEGSEREVMTPLPPIVYCSASYGIIVNELYDKRKHELQRHLEKRENKVDGKSYAVGQIHWLILKGTSISPHEPVNHMFHRVVDVDTPKLTWKDAVAISKLDPSRLPQNIYEGDAKKLCEITSLLNVRALGPNSKGVRRRRRPVWKTPQEYFEIEQKVLVNIGSVDLKFAVQFQETIIGTQDAIPVRWMYMDSHRGREDDFEEGQQVDYADDSWQHGLFAS